MKLRALAEPMSLIVPPAVLDALVVQARQAHPNEVCGALLGRDAQVVRAVPLENVSPEPALTYEASPEETLALFHGARTEGLEVVGYYHSHPDAPPVLSRGDAEAARRGLSTGMYQVIVSVYPGATPAFGCWVMFGGALLPAPL
jgi:desampylase